MRDALVCVCTQVHRRVARISPTTNRPVFELSLFSIRKRERGVAAGGASGGQSGGQSGGGGAGGGGGGGGESASAQTHEWELVQLMPGAMSLHSRDSESPRAQSFMQVRDHHMMSW